MANRIHSWFGPEFDDEGNRRKLRRSLRRRAKGYTTLYWNSDFIDWLVYEGTIFPCGPKVKSVTPDFCTFEADAAGVQSEGICLTAVFKVETVKFTRCELKQMVHDFEFSASGERLCALFPTETIVRLEWHYDGAYDET